MAVEKDILQFGISTDTPETKKTQESLSEMLMFPAKLATSFTTHMAIYAWSFNQIHQMIRTTYEWWEEKNRKITEQLNEHVRILQQSVSGMNNLSGINIPRVIAADTELAQSMGGGVQGLDVARMRKAISDVAGPDRVQGMLIPSMQLFQAFPEIPQSSIAGALKPVMSSYGYGEAEAASITSGILRGVGARAPELAGMMGRQGGAAAIYAPNLQDFVFLNALVAAGGTPAMRGGTEVTSAMRSWYDAMQGGGEGRVEGLLGADVFEGGKVKDAQKLAEATAALYLSDQKGFNRLRQYMGKTSLSDRLLSRMAVAGMTKEQAERMAHDTSLSDEARDEAANYLSEGKFGGAMEEARNAVAGMQLGMASENLAKMREIQKRLITGEQAGGAVYSDIASTRPPMQQMKMWAIDVLKGKGGEKGLTDAAKASGEWGANLWTEPGVHKEIQDIYESGISGGASDEEIATMVLAELYWQTYGMEGDWKGWKKAGPWQWPAGKPYQSALTGRTMRGGEGAFPEGWESLVSRALPGAIQRVQDVRYPNRNEPAPINVGVQNNYSVPNKTEQSAVRAGVGTDNTTNAGR